MLLALDAGNTQTVAGLYHGAEPVEHWRTTTVRTHTADELALELRGLLELRGRSLADVTGVCLASGVPALTVEYAAVARDRLRCPAVIVGPGVETGVGMRVDSPDEVGPDRIANAAAAFARYGGPCVVVDFGTAINFDAVSAEGDFVGGAIAPGVQVATDALRDRAARLGRSPPEGWRRSSRRTARPSTTWSRSSRSRVCTSSGSAIRLEPDPFG